MKSTETMEAPAASPQSVWAPIATAVAPAPEITLIGANEKPIDRGLSLLLYAIRTRELSLIDMPLLTESAAELAAIAQSELKSIRLDPTVFEDMRSFVQNADMSFLTSAPGRAAGAMRGLVTMRSRPRAQAQDASYPTHVKKIRIEPVAPLRSGASRAPRRLPRVRFGRVLVRGVFLGVVVTVAMTMPPEVMGQLLNRAANEVVPAIETAANEVGPAIEKAANDAGPVIEAVSSTISSTIATVGSAIGEKLSEAQQSSTLARATFEVPPLSAYGAAFEAQAPYPTARPNGTVEWVVALRNTGSAGWYRGIDGAQASLALADGTQVAVQTTPYVGPGQVGWFVVHFPAPSNVGTSNVKLLPRIDGRGALPDLGIYATVTVSPNP